jgi:HEAT repeat protein
VSTKKHIFLSYRSTESDFALKLAADLKNAGVNLWMDRLDIKPGEDWINALQKAVNDCIAIVAIISPEYVTSKYCRRELARADRMGHPIIPVLLRHVTPNEWPMEVERSQYIDFSQWQDESVYCAQVDRLVRNLKEEFAGQVKDAPNAETRYLTTLIAELEARRGVLDYVDLSASTKEANPTNEMRPKPRADDTWGINVPVAVLEGETVDAQDGVRNESRKTLLGSILEAVKRYPQFVLIGPAGIGKTTSLRRLALDAAHARLKDSQSAPLPLLLFLPTWTNHSTPEQWIRAQWSLDSDPLPLLVEGKIALYLDGLNEMGASQAHKIKLLRDWLHSANAPKHVIVTSQTSGFDDHQTLGLPIVVAEEMDDERIRRFVANYLDTEAANALLDRIIRKDTQVADNTGQLYALARNPLLLTALIFVYNNSPDGELPRNMGALFKRLVMDLWERERVRQTPGWVPFEAMEAAFSRLAYASFDEDTPIFLSRESALRHLGGEDLLLAASAASIIGVQNDSVFFFHQPVREYLAAVRLIPVGLATKLMQSRFDRWGNRVAQKWDRVIVALSGIAPNPDAVVRVVAEVDPFLALECIASGISVSAEAQEETIARLKQMLINDGNDGRVAAGKMLAAIGDHDALTILLDAMRSGAWEVRQSAAATLRGVRIPPLPGLIEALHDWDQDIREATAAAVRKIGAPAVPVLLEVLHHEHWSLRRGAAWALGEIGDQAAVPGLIEALGDDDALVRKEAALALGWLRDPAAVSSLLEALGDKDWRVRKVAAETLGWIGKPALEGLLNALNDTSNNVRRVAAEALGRIGDPMAVSPLLDLLRDDQSEVRAAAMEALGWIRDPSAALSLMECLADTTTLKYDERRLCDIAAGALEQIGTEDALAALEWWRQGNPVPGREVGMNDNVVVARFIDSLNDEDSLVRWAAVKALATFKDAAAINGLLRALHDKEVLVCDAASEALVRIGAPAVLGLLESLRDSNSNVRGAAIDALGKIKDPLAVASLIPCLEDESKPWLDSERICDLALKALENIATPEARAAAEEWRRRHRPATVPGTPEQILVFQRSDLPNLLEALHDEDWTRREEAAKSLREQAQLLKGKATPTLVKTLSDALQDSDWFVRWAVAETLAWIADKSSVPALTGLLGDPSWTVRVAAVRALAEIRDTVCIAALTTALKDEAHPVREVAAEALGIIGSPDALPALVDALGNSEPFVKRAVIEALGAIGDPTPVPQLLDLLHDDEVHLRWSTAEALGRMKDARAVPALIERLEDLEPTDWDDKRVCDVVADALEGIGTPEARAAVDGWRQSQLRQQGVKL